ncbi:ribosomal protein S18-alanine N-acetyltransferase [Ornithinibacillus salinisoli]|uniref:[Ribosomal protein bS18]-alanine N-acetyltransferase n=1 Tax=Ornithinibacillus salinisoli TaxID=1848459 RepID=A0ABW4W413_9BACI
MAELMIRKMEISDINDVMEVEKKSFSSPWTEEIFNQELVENKHAHYFVMLIEKKVIGYVGLWAILDDAQITNIAILPELRGNKFGEKLFRFTIQQVLRMGANRLSLEVRASNTVAQHLYRKFGLVPGGIRKNYYRDNNEDAIVMWVNLS